MENIGESEIANFQARQEYRILGLLRLPSLSSDFIDKDAEKPPYLSGSDLPGATGGAGFRTPGR